MDIIPAQEVNKVGVLVGHQSPLKEILVFPSVPTFTHLDCPGSQQSPSLVHAKHVINIARLP